MRITIKRARRYLWLKWEWVTYNSAYGLGMGYTWTKREAERRADRCAVELFSYE